MGGRSENEETIAAILRSQSPGHHNPNLLRDLYAILKQPIMEAVLYLIWSANIYSEYDLHCMDDDEVDTVASMLLDPAPFYAEIARQHLHNEQADARRAARGSDDIIQAK